MRNISLLPVELKQYRKSAQKWNVFIVVLCSLVAALILIYLGMTAFMLMPGGELEVIKQERADVQKRITELKPYEEKLNNAKAIESLVSEAMGVNPAWGSLFTSVYNKMPDSVWITDFSVGFTGETGDYDMKGSARSHEDVANWLRDLQGMTELSDIQCQFATKNDSTGGTDTVQFEIKAKILPGQAYEPSTRGVLNP